DALSRRRRMCRPRAASLVALDRRRARVVELLADAIFGAPPLLLRERPRFHFLAQTADLIEGAALGTIGGDRALEWRRRAPNFLDRRGVLGQVGRRRCPAFSPQQLSLAPRQLDVVAFTVWGHVDPVEVVRQLTYELDTHLDHRLVCRSLLNT